MLKSLSLCNKVLSCIISLSLSVCLCLCLSLSVFVSVSVCPSLSLLSLTPFVSVCLSVCLSVSLSDCLAVWLSDCLTVSFLCRLLQTYGSQSYFFFFLFFNAVVFCLYASEAIKKNIYYVYVPVCFQKDFSFIEQ